MLYVIVCTQIYHLIHLVYLFWYLTFYVDSLAITVLFIEIKIIELIWMENPKIAEFVLKQQFSLINE